MSYIRNNPLKLPDGREVIGTLAAAGEINVTSAYFPKIAEREGLQRFGRRNATGRVAHFYLVEEVEALKAKRQGFESEVPSDTFVPLPFDNSQDQV